MAKKTTIKEQSVNNTVEKPKLFTKIKQLFANETFRFVAGLLLVIFAVYLILAFSSFFVTGAADQSVIDAQELSGTKNGIKNYAGSRGAQVASYLINDCFGVSSFFIVLFLGVLGLRLMRVRMFVLSRWFIVCTLLLLWFSLFFGFAFSEMYADSFLLLGGMHGYNVGLWLESQVGTPGVWMILLATAVCFFIYLSARTIEWLRKIFSLSFLPKRRSSETNQETKSNWEDESTEMVDDLNKNNAVEEKNISSEVESSNEEILEDNTIELDVETPIDNEVESETEEVTEKEEEETLDEENGDEDTDDDLTFTVDNIEEEEFEGCEMEPYNPRLDLEFYKYPTIDLLKVYDNTPSIDMEEQNSNKERIVQVLRSFGIEISSIHATVGPTVTLYEIKPVEGVRIAKIRNLEDDIALNIAALGIRIIAPIPGKGTIGIEVPNKNPKIVSGQSILGSKKYQETDFELPMVLGKTITGEVFMEDLAKMPHVLVAGATGQGKSVGLNTIIASLLYKKHPSELKFVLIDPKKLEFAPYSILENHFLAKLPDEVEPVITDVSKVVQTLKSLCIEMDTRYDLLKAAGVKNIKEYNAKFIARKLNPEKGHHFLPYIVVVIDEFGDLILTAGKDVEVPIARIAQLARAAGIHMIIATQRPTTTIITGNIKANFPARVAFRVMQRIDSSTILDRTGANQLVGKGDMLFSKGGEPVRVQCAFIDTPEIENITHYIAQQQGYLSAFPLPEVPDESEPGDLGDVDMAHLDPLFKDAAELIVSNQQGSTSLIQRKFAIGYNRAGRLMDQLEKAGIVGPAQGSKPREVHCISLDDLDQRLSNIL